MKEGERGEKGVKEREIGEKGVKEMDRGEKEGVKWEKERGREVV